MLRPDPANVRVFLHRAPVDMRKQRNGLASLVESVIQQDPFSAALFCFANKRRDKLKILYWERNGFVVWYKVLEEQKFAWPKRDAAEVLTITGEQLNWLLDGYDVWAMKPHKTLHFKAQSVQVPEPDRL